ncbi:MULTISPECIES: alpha/beta fold hydrolase [unclassified Burkholderia]|uniref:alpha/beta fold hydrolase n=1 Tax=unclassified Burkholderia TaxID=2613784 RepID=UPI0021AB4B72|nr:MULTISPECIES: hypothetical protein [unclassified Burkholderia]
MLIAVLSVDADGLRPAAGGRALADALPRVSHKVLRACGHPLMLERPREVERVLLTLLAEPGSMSSRYRDSRKR